MRVELKFDPFNGTNFELWKFDIVAVFRQQKLYDVVEGTEVRPLPILPVAAVPPVAGVPGNLAAITARELLIRQ